VGLKRTLARRLAVPARAYVRSAPVRAGKPVLVRRLLEPALRGAPRSFVVTTVDGFSIGGSTADMIQRYLYVFGVWEPDLTAWMRSRLSPGRTLIDVGANIGYFTLLGSRLVGPTGAVVAVEALPATYAQLQANLDRNAATNVRALNVAATATPGTVTLFGGEAHNSGTTSTVETAGLTRLDEIEGAPLADLLTPDEIATARVVKIDVEGAEHDVLRGLEPALDAMPADVELVVEVSPDDQVAAGARPEAPIELLADHGFHPYRINNNYAPVSYLDPASTAPPPRFRGPLTERMDLVFSRTDADVLR
jgi:FkbM family methyltransferase